MKGIKIKTIWDSLKNDSDFVSYFPDKYTKGIPNRRFFFVVTLIRSYIITGGIIITH